MLLKLVAIYQAVVAKNYLEAVRLVAQLLLELTEPHPPMMASGDELNSCLDECQKIEKCLADATAVGAGGETENPAIWVPIILAAIQVFAEWLKNRRKEA